MSAGTVEFIYEYKADKFYFLEVQPLFEFGFVFGIGVKVEVGVGVGVGLLSRGPPSPLT